MDLELQEVNSRYKRNLQRLENYVKSIYERVKRWRISAYYRNYYYRMIQRWHNQQKQRLLNEKNAEISKIRAKYSKPVNRRKKACLVGINYENTQYRLNGCVNDVFKMRNMLVNHYGYHNNDVKLILNQHASRNTILREFISLVNDAVEGDTIWFSFSGHGVYLKDRSGDEKDGKDELIVTSDFYGIYDDEFKHILQRYLKKGVKLFALFDNCHSGTILDLRYQYMKNEPLTIHNGYEDTKGDVMCISGCMDSQTSIDAYLEGKYNGAMTWALVDLLSKEKDLTWEQCINKVRQKLKDRKFHQIPQLTSGTKMEITKEKVVF